MKKTEFRELQPAYHHYRKEEATVRYSKRFDALRLFLLMKYGKMEQVKKAITHQVVRTC